MADASKLKIVFAGSGAFAVPSLKILAQNDEIEILAVITGIDKPAGRGKLLAPGIIKVEAEKLGLKVYQPQNVLEIRNLKFEIDILVVVSYGKILPNEILDWPKNGCLNLHASLLPRHRGAACVAATILAGDASAGVTVMKLDKGLDTGPILAQDATPVEAGETTGELTVRLSDLGAPLLVKALKDHAAGALAPYPQDESLASYAPKLKKEDGYIDWTESAELIVRRVRAYHPWPGASALLPDGQRLKIIRALASTDPGKPGEIFAVDQTLAIGTGVGSIMVSELQLPGKKPTTGQDFLLGHRSLLGRSLE